MMPPIKALIVGGGISGPAAAYWLARSGADVTLIERASDIRATGQQIDIRLQGVPLMRKMGDMEASVKAATVHETGMQLIDRHGRTKAFFPAGDSGSGAQNFTSEFEIMRGDLVHILFDLTKNFPNVKTRFNTTVVDFTQDDESLADGKVHVTFNDGQQEDFDVLIGADGTYSKTRRILLGPDAPSPITPLGGYIGYYSVPSESGDSDRATFCHLPKSRVPRLIGTRKDRQDVTRIYMIVRGQDKALDAAHRDGDLAKLKQGWASIYENGDWQCQRFVKALLHSPEADDLYSSPFQEVNLPPGSWSRGRVVLIGDAAHTQTANGRGSNWALVGAYVLAGEIAKRFGKDGRSTSAAIIEGAKGYEQVFRPIATASHNGKGQISSTMVPESALGIRLLHIGAKLATYLPLGKMMQGGEETDKWQLPEYPEMNQDNTAATA